MNTDIYRIFAGLLLPIAGLLYGCNAGQANTVDPAETVTALPVSVTWPVISDLQATYTATGALEAESEAAVRARVMGEIREILVEEGDVVVRGQLLARLDTTRLQLEANRTLAELEKARQNYRRNQQLNERGLVSPQAYEDLELIVDERLAAYELAALELSYTEIRSPISGTLASRLVKTGNLAKRQDVLFLVSETSELTADLRVPQSELRKFEVGQKATFIVDALPGDRFEGEILRISPTIDPTSGTARITVAALDSSGELRPGMFARVDLLYDTHKNALVVPSNAISVEDSEPVIWVFKDGIATRRAVVTGLNSGEQVEVVSGLGPDEQIIVAGQAGLRPGSRVTVAQAKPASGV